METAVYLACGSLFLGTLGFMWKLSTDLRRFNSEVGEKRKRVYERLDEYKEDSELKFVRKDMCEILHKQLVTNVEEIKLDVKRLLTKNGIKP